MDYGTLILEGLIEKIQKYTPADFDRLIAKANSVIDPDDKEALNIPDVLVRFSPVSKSSEPRQFFQEPIQKRIVHFHIRKVDEYVCVADGGPDLSPWMVYKSLQERTSSRMDLRRNRCHRIWHSG